MTSFRVFIIGNLVGLLICVSEAEISFDVSPKNCTELVDIKVTLTCEMNSVPRPGQLIQIARQPNEQLALITFGNEIVYGAGRSQRIQAEGQNSLDSPVSRLKVTILSPQQEDSGIYTCSGVSFDDSGLVELHTSQSFLHVNKLDISAQAVKIRELEAITKTLVAKMANGNLGMDATSTPAFSATIGRQKYFITESQHIVFDNVITNHGNAYDAYTGKFTAPISGLYAFFLNLEMEEKGAGAGFSLRAGNRELGRLYVENKDHGDQSAISSVVYLSQGTKVEVVVSYKEKPRAYLYHNCYSTFSGFLVASQN